MSRRSSYDKSKPGIVMMSLCDIESKRKVMKAKQNNWKIAWHIKIFTNKTNDKGILDANNRRLQKATGKDLTSVAG